MLREAREQQINAQTALAQASPSTNKTAAPAKVDKEAQRKENARRREQTRPLRKKMEQLEKSIEKAQVQLTTIENQLGDSAIYEADRKAELLQLMDQQTAQKASLAQDEEQLLELMMELEELEASFEG